MHQASNSDTHPGNAGNDCRIIPELELGYDEAKLLYWLRQRNIGRFVTTTTKVDWDEFKKQLVLKDGQLIYPGTGETVDGVTLLKRMSVNRTTHNRKEVN